MNTDEITLPKPTGRPESWDDLNFSDQYPEKVATIDILMLADVEYALGAAALQVAAEAKQDPHVLVMTKRGTIEVFLIPDDEDKSKALQAAQKQWDECWDEWRAVMLCEPRKFVHEWLVTRWAMESGVPVPTREQFKAQEAITKKVED